MAPTIGLLGDVMLGRTVAERLVAGPPSEVWSPGVREVCSRCDAIVLNLECCLSDRGSPTDLIPNKAFFFRAPPRAVEALRVLGDVVVAGLANNHALDYGSEALDDTLDRLSRAGVVATGAGRDADSARRGAVVSVGGARLGVLALSDHPSEFAAGPAWTGIAHAELQGGLPDWVRAELGALGKSADLVLVFPHWGPNMSARPARWQRLRGRELIGAGAHAVAGHSAHVFHGVAPGPVLYDLGGALDDYAIDRELRNDLGVLALWRPGGDPQLELVGLHLDFCRTELVSGERGDWIAARLERACRKLGTSVRRVDEARFALEGAEPTRLSQTRRG